MCAYLNVINLHDNILTGTIPPQLGLLAQLSVFARSCLGDIFNSDLEVKVTSVFSITEGATLSEFSIHSELAASCSSTVVLTVGLLVSESDQSYLVSHTLQVNIIAISCLGDIFNSDLAVKVTSVFSIAEGATLTQFL
ncbi:hypothetical protein L2E82_10655 [Cichorium intybus]|uniref:Uncharacterized protein n=1 Tax=Cichorium intybus TaxID=13427 RepID=A0ACB9GAN2_CICIN|nr:hypothetical protein L2E82_10655 [Cichorium intybus]